MDHEIAYWRMVEIEDVELAVDAQKGFVNGTLGKGRIHPTQGKSGSLLVSSRMLTSFPEHAVAWYQKKVKDILTRHAEMEAKEGKNIDYSVPEAQSSYEEGDALCRMLGPEYEF